MNDTIILNQDIYDKLQKLYHYTDIKYTNTNTDSGILKNRKINFLTDQNIYLMAMNYHMLEGYSLQWSIPEKTIRYISETFNCHTELFASPFNVKLKYYYSLFQRDMYFGSRGNFFNAPDSDFIRGSYEVNPPFIEIIFLNAIHRILKFLTIAEKNGERLTFIFIIPAWQDCPPLNIIENS